MDAKTIEKMRRNQTLRKLDDGREGVDVTLQFVGSVPQIPRYERKQWLEERFSRVRERVGEAGLDVKPDSLSVSGQTIEAIVALSELENLREKLTREDVRIDVMSSTQVVDSRSA